MSIFVLNDSACFTYLILISTIRSPLVMSLNWYSSKLRDSILNTLYSDKISCLWACLEVVFRIQYIYYLSWSFYGIMTLFKFKLVKSSISSINFTDQTNLSFFLFLNTSLFEAKWFFRQANCRYLLKINEVTTVSLITKIIQNILKLLPVLVLSLRIFYWRVLCHPL